MSIKNKGPKRILMIDDDDFFGVIAEAIQQKGHIIELDVNLADALDTLSSNKNGFDAILLDLSMKGADLPPSVINIWRKNPGMFSGWAFYEYVLLRDYPFLAQNTMIVSGLLSDFDRWVLPNRPVEWDRLLGSKRVLAKKDHDIVKRILDFLDNIR